MAYPATYDSVRTSVIEKLRLDATADKTRAGEWINQTYANVAMETRCFQATGTATLTTAVSYTLDSQILHIELITCTPVGGLVWFPLKQAQLDEILNYRALGMGTSPPARRYCLVGLNQLELWPTPNAGDVLSIWYSYLPTALTNDADVPAIPEPFGSKLLEYGALVQGAEFKRDVMMLGDFQAQYAGWMQAFQRYTNRKQGAYPETFPTWTRLNPWVPMDPSADVPDYGMVW